MKIFHFHFFCFLSFVLEKVLLVFFLFVRLQLSFFYQNYIFLELVLILNSFLFWGSNTNNKFLFSIAQLIQNNPTFSCAFFIFLFQILRFLQINFELNYNFFHQPVNSLLETQKNMRPLDKFSTVLACYFTYRDDCAIYK